jgi:hypothetical protein
MAWFSGWQLDMHASTTTIVGDRRIALVTIATVAMGEGWNNSGNCNNDCQRKRENGSKNFLIQSFSPPFIIVLQKIGFKHHKIVKPLQPI